MVRTIIWHIERRSLLSQKPSPCTRMEKGGRMLDTINKIHPFFTDFEVKYDPFLKKNADFFKGKNTPF